MWHIYTKDAHFQCQWFSVYTLYSLGFARPCPKRCNLYDCNNEKKKNNLTQFDDKIPYNNVKTQKHHRIFDYTTIAGRLRTTCWCNSWNDKSGFKGAYLPNHCNSGEIKQTQHNRKIVYNTNFFGWQTSWKRGWCNKSTQLQLKSNKSIEKWRDKEEFSLSPVTNDPILTKFKTAKLKIDYRTNTDRLRPISWNNYSQRMHIHKLVYTSPHIDWRPTDYSSGDDIECSAKTSMVSKK